MDQDLTPLKPLADTSKLGTSEQCEIVNDYPMENNEEKLKVPYIERMNGNLCV